MQYSTQRLFDLDLEDMVLEDEIDELFSQLLQIEPPSTVVENILATVAHLPLPQYLGRDDIEGLLTPNTLQIS